MSHAGIVNRVNAVAEVLLKLLYYSLITGQCGTENLLKLPQPPNFQSTGLSAKPDKTLAASTIYRLLLSGDFHIYFPYSIKGGVKTDIFPNIRDATKDKKELVRYGR